MYSSELHASYGNCHKLTDVMSSGIIGEYVQFIPLQSTHPTVQSKPCFLYRYVHRPTLVLQFVLQLHLIIFSTAWGAIGKCVVCGLRWPSMANQPHSSGFKFNLSIHSF